MSVRQNAYSFMENPRENQRLAAKVDPKQWVEEYLEPCLPEVARILDVGSGPGVIACAIAEAFAKAKVVAFDMSPTKVGAVRENIASKPNVAVGLGDANSLPFDANSFDFVFARFLSSSCPCPTRLCQKWSEYVGQVAG